MWSTRCSCQNIMKLQFSLQVFLKKKKKSNSKLHKNSSSLSRVVLCGETDSTKLIVAFRNFANAPKSGQYAFRNGLVGVIRGVGDKERSGGVGRVLYVFGRWHVHFPVRTEDWQSLLRFSLVCLSLSCILPQIRPWSLIDTVIWATVSAFLYSFQDGAWHRTTYFFWFFESSNLDFKQHFGRVPCFRPRVTGIWKFVSSCGSPNRVFVSITGQVGMLIRLDNQAHTRCSTFPTVSKFSSFRRNWF
jgi:hypothetical protein